MRMSVSMRNEKKKNQRMRMKVCLKKICDGSQMMIYVYSMMMLTKMMMMYSLWSISSYSLYSFLLSSHI